MYFLSSKCTKTLNIARYSFLLTLLLTAAVFCAGMAMAGILPGQPYCAIYTDTWDQMAGMQAMLARQLLNGENIFYSWDTSLGQNTALIYAFCAYSPTTLFYMLIPDAYTATIVSLIIKIALSGMCFHLFLQYGMHWKGPWIVFFSLCYGLCGFQFEYMLSSNLLDGLYLLPLVMLCLCRALRSGRFTLLSIAYALTFIIQFYCGFLIGLFSSAALMGLLFLRDGKLFIKKNIRLLSRYVLCVLTAVLLSMCLLLPAIMFLLNSTGFNSILTRTKIVPWDLIYAFTFGRSTSLVTDIPYLYCGLPVLISLPFYFTDKRFPKRERWLMGAVMLSIPLTLYLDPLYYLLHAFNRPDGFTVRYAFLYVFVMVVLASRIFNYEAERKKPAVKSLILYFSAVTTGICGIILLHRYFGEAGDGNKISFALKGTLILVPLWGIISVSSLKLKKNIIILISAYILLCLELGAQVYFNGGEQGTTDSTNYHSWNRQMQDFMRQMNTDTDSEIYRAHLGNSPNANNSAIYGYMGIGQFASGNYAALYELLKKIGDEVSAVRYTQTGATDATDMIFGIKYRGYLTKETFIYGNERPAYEQYDRALPLGFAASADIINNIKFTGDALENQNRLISALCGLRAEVYHKAEDYAYQENNAVCSFTGEKYEISVAPEVEAGDILFGIPAGEYEHAYAYFDLFGDDDSEDGEIELPPDMTLNVAAFSPADRKASGCRYENVLGNSIIEMTQDGDSFYMSVAVFEDNGKVYRYAKPCFYYQDEQILDAVSEYLKTGGWNAKHFENGHIEADFTLSKEKPILFMSIPYDKGWSVYIDGKKTTAVPAANGSFMAVTAGVGDHEIVMEYESPGENEGLILTALGIILLLLLLLHEIRVKEAN